MEYLSAKYYHNNFKIGKPYKNILSLFDKNYYVPTTTTIDGNIVTVTVTFNKKGQIYADDFFVVKFNNQVRQLVMDTINSNENSFTIFPDFKLDQDSGNKQEAIYEKNIQELPKGSYYLTLTVTWEGSKAYSNDEYVDITRKISENIQKVVNISFIDFEYLFEKGGRISLMVDPKVLLQGNKDEINKKIIRSTQH